MLEKFVAPLVTGARPHLGPVCSRRAPSPICAESVVLAQHPGDRQGGAVVTCHPAEVIRRLERGLGNGLYQRGTVVPRGRSR